MIDDLGPLLNFTQEEWNVIKPLLHKVIIDTDAILFYEGTEEKDLFYLNEGNLLITKKGLPVATLGPGSWIGEISALAKGISRTATVKATSRSVLWKLSLEDLNKATQHDHDIYLKVVIELSKGMAYRLSFSTDAAIEQKLESAQTKVVMAEFLCAVLFGLTSFLYALQIIKLLHLKPRVSAAISIPLILLLSYFLIAFIKKSSLPIQSFGLTWRNWKKSISESLLWTIPLILGTLLVKWALIATLPMYKKVPLIHFHDLLKAHLPTEDWLLMTIGYALFVPLQALMVNGAMQTAFANFFEGPKKNFRAIFLSNLIFSTLHLHISMSFAISVFFIGCVWGWLYSRHQTIVGISLSHMIMGIWGGVFMGLL